jgi:hypothetical protein
MGRAARRSRVLEFRPACSDCLNPPAARSFLPLILKKTEWVLAGRSKAQIAAELQTAFDKKALPTLEPGAMCYMLSKQGYITDRGGHWRPHVMFFVPLTEAKVLGRQSTGIPDSGG